MKINFDLVDMQLLIHIAEEQNLTRGAERSNLSLPSASMRIKLFEESIGTKLLYRAKQGATLTPAGIRLVHHARIVMGQLENLRGDLHEYTSGVKGHVRIFANATSISTSLPEILRRYLTAYPNVDVDLRERLSDDGVRAVSDNAADIAIVAGDTRTDGLEVLPFTSEALVLATSLNHPLAARECVSFSETVEYPYVGLQEGSALFRFLTKQAQELRSPLAVRIQVGSFDAICRMIEANVGIGILPVSAAKRYSRVMQIRIIPLEDPWSTRHSMICVRSLALLPAFGQRLVAMLSEAGSQGMDGSVLKE
jgi:DNA-binding transcriptional LysR family regulator